MALQNRYEFMYYVACTNANPNGDPDMGNMPRIDPQTMQGFIWPRNAAFATILRLLIRACRAWGFSCRRR